MRVPPGPSCHCGGTADAPGSEPGARKGVGVQIPSVAFRSITLPWRNSRRAILRRWCPKGRGGANPLGSILGPSSIQSRHSPDKRESAVRIRVVLLCFHEIGRTHFECAQYGVTDRALRGLKVPGWGSSLANGRSRESMLEGKPGVVPGPGC